MYSKEAILNMIDNYQMTCKYLITVIPDCDSSSIAQYGIQATLPKPQGKNGSKVEDTVIPVSYTHLTLPTILPV